jgi:prevent-host-death family protein
MAALSVTELRHVLSDTLNAVKFEGERVLLLRQGKPVAALVSVEDMELLERIEDEGLIRLADEADKESEGQPDIPYDEMKRRLGL